MLVITPGEPAGIGRELVVQLAQAALQPETWLVVADPELLQARATQLGLRLQLRFVTDTELECLNAPGTEYALPT